MSHFLLQNAIITDFNASGCYDRVIKEIADINYQRAGATNNTAKASFLVKRNTRHQLRTAHGIYNEYFNGGPNDEQEW